ncbi:hypothetical protein PSPO01_12410 [Paraphaeosphaeria sporulosa]
MAVLWPCSHAHTPAILEEPTSLAGHRRRLGRHVERQLELALARETYRRFRKDAPPDATRPVAQHYDLQFDPLLLSHALMSEVSVGFSEIIPRTNSDLGTPSRWREGLWEPAAGQPNLPTLHLASEGISEALGLRAVIMKLHIYWSVDFQYVEWRLQQHAPCAQDRTCTTTVPSSTVHGSRWSGWVQRTEFSS